MMNRKEFLHIAAITSAAAALWLTNPLAAFGQLPVARRDKNRVLVLIQLNGGNDGLSSLVPMSEYGRLTHWRANILVPEKELTSLTDELSLHPSLSKFAGLFKEGKFGIIQNVGYPNQNRSHFRSLDIWNSASPANEFWDTGWLGRFFEQKYEGFPNNYPNEKHPHPFAISLGNILADNCQGKSANFGFALNNPDNFSLLNEADNLSNTSDPYQDMLRFLQTNLQQTNRYGEAIAKVAKKGRNLADYPDTPLAQQLKTVARLIAGGAETTVYTLTLHGFDTHAHQTDKNNPSKGIHANLLLQLAEAIYAFQTDLEKLEIEDRVLGVTYSEFGRQIRSNHSWGTDHGSAAPMFLFGKATKQRIIGKNPIIPEKVELQEALPLQFDFRDVYGSLLVDWFGVDKEKVSKILQKEFKYTSII